MRGLRASPLLVTTNFANVNPESAQCRRFCTGSTRAQKNIATVSPAFRDYTNQEFREVSACRSHAVHHSMQSPVPSFLLMTFRKSSEHLTRNVCLHERAHKVASLHTEIVQTCAQKKSPSLFTGEGVGANTSSLVVVAQSSKTHRDLTSFPFIRRAQLVSKMDFLGGTCSSLIQEYSCKSFICVSSRSSPALAVGGKSVDEGTLVPRASCRFLRLANPLR